MGSRYLFLKPVVELASLLSDLQLILSFDFKPRMLLPQFLFFFINPFCEHFIAFLEITIDLMEFLDHYRELSVLFLKFLLWLRQTKKKRKNIVSFYKKRMKNNMSEMIDMNKL